MEKKQVFSLMTLLPDVTVSIILFIFLTYSNLSNRHLALNKHSGRITVLGREYFTIFMHSNTKQVQKSSNEQD